MRRRRYNNIENNIEQWADFWAMLARIFIVLAVIAIVLCAIVQTASAAYWIAGTANIDIDGMSVIAYAVNNKNNYTEDVVGMNGSAHFKNWYMIDIESITGFERGVQICVELVGTNCSVIVNTTYNGWDLAPIMK